MPRTGGDDEVVELPHLARGIPDRVPPSGPRDFRDGRGDLDTNSRQGPRQRVDVGARATHHLPLIGAPEPAGFVHDEILQRVVRGELPELLQVHAPAREEEGIDEPMLERGTPVQALHELLDRRRRVPG